MTLTHPKRICVPQAGEKTAPGNQWPQKIVRACVGVGYEYPAILNYRTTLFSNEVVGVVEHSDRDSDFTQGVRPKKQLPATISWVL